MCFVFCSLCFMFYVFQIWTFFEKRDVKGDVFVDTVFIIQRWRIFITIYIYIHMDVYW